MKFFFPLIGVVFLIAFIFNLSELYYLVYLSLGLFLIIKYSNKKAKENLRLERNLSQDRIFIGEEIEVNLKLINTGFWPIFWLSYNDVVPVKLRLPLNSRVTILFPKESVEFSYNLSGVKRGIYDVGPFRVTYGDPFGFEEERLSFASERKLIVYPKIIPFRNLGLPSRIAFGEIIWPQRIYQDPNMFRGLREYQRGDSLRDIYWPASANNGELVVKEYESTVTIENMIFLNLAEQDYGISGLDAKIETAIETAASIANYLTQKNQTVGLASNGRDELRSTTAIKAGQGKEHLMKIMEFLARVDTTREDDFIELVQDYSKHLATGSTIIIITREDTKELIKLLLKLCRKGLNAIIIVIAKDVKHNEFLNRQYTENLVIYRLKDQSSIYSLEDKTANS